MCCYLGLLTFFDGNDTRREVTAGFVLVGAYVLFMRKYYHLHEEYLASLKKCDCENIENNKNIENPF